MHDRKFPAFISAVFLISWHFAAATAALAAELADEFSACRLLESAAERLDCYDGAIDRHNKQEPSVAAPPSPEELFGKNANEMRRAVEQATGGEQIDQIEAQVTELLSIAPGKVAITLDNGQLWRQTSTSNLRLAEGDAVTIRTASMGSYMLHKVGSARSMRVQRSN